jgi:AcrR family transcriptional regulator
MPGNDMPVDRRAQRREAKRTRIVAEAWTLAHRDGLAAVSLRDLAKRVDLRQPSLYAYFESKHDLYDVMFADGNRQLLGLIAAQPPADDPRVALTDFVRMMVQFSTEDVVRHQLLFQRTIPGFEPSPESYALAVAVLDIGRARLAAAGVTNPRDVDVFTALVSGLAHQQVANDPGGERWVRLAEQAVEMFLSDVERRRDHRPVRNPRSVSNPRSVGGKQ